MFLNKKVAVILPVAGSGKRMGGDQKKQFLKLGGKTILEWSLSSFLKLAWIDGIWLVSPSQDASRVREKALELAQKTAFTGEVHVVCGGLERQHSVCNGLFDIPDDYDYVIVHDGVRPFVSEKLLLQQIDLVAEAVGCILATPSTDTLKRVDNQQVVETLNRSEIWRVQTPQIFRRVDLRLVHEKAKQEGFLGTDDASLFEHYGLSVLVLEGTPYNIKITTPYDLVIGEAIVQWLKESEL